MADEDDGSLAEKRRYGETTDETHAYVASGLGVTRVGTAGGQIGRFSLVERCAAGDIAGDAGEVAVATDEDVLVLGADGFVEAGFAPAGFGPPVAVGYGDGLHAAARDGTVARYDDDRGWEAIGSVGDVRAIADGRLASADGVYALDDDLDSLGLDDVRDVDGAYAATDDGLYRQAGDGGDATEAWTRVHEGPHHAVSADRHRVHAAAGDALFERRDGGWQRCSLPASGRVVDVAHGQDTYAITVAGTFLVATDATETADGHAGWRSRGLGVPAVAGLAVP